MSAFLPLPLHLPNSLQGILLCQWGSEQPVFRVSWGLWDLRRIGDRKGLCTVSHKPQDNFQLDGPEQGWVVVLLLRRAEGKEPTEGQARFIGHMQGPRAHPSMHRTGWTFPCTDPPCKHAQQTAWNLEGVQSLLCLPTKLEGSGLFFQLEILAAFVEN